MNGSKTWFEDFISEEVKKYKGVYHPIRVGLLHRLLVRYVPCKRIHPNPDDEFCDPRIGPNNEIISRYAEEIRVERIKEGTAKPFKERVMIQRIYPDGYMLLNGHHRWGAAIRMGQPKIRAKVVNLTQLSDIHDMIRDARHDKRVTLDLDEVVFAQPGVPTEKALPFPLNKQLKEPLRLGVQALFRFLKKNGYDIWVYSANYYSMDYIRRYFAAHRAWVDGVVTGTARKGWLSEAERKQLDAMVANKYAQTIHIDNQSLMRVNRGSRDFEEYALSGNPATWSEEIREIIGAFDKHEG